QSARRAARLGGWKIDFVSKSDEKKREEQERASRVEVERLGLGEATTEKLISAGIETVQELVATPMPKLVEIPGIGEKTAEKVLATAQEYLAAHPAQPVGGEAAEMEFTPEMEPGAEAAVPAAAETPVPAPEASAPGRGSGEAAPTTPEPEPGPEAPAAEGEPHV